VSARRKRGRLLPGSGKFDELWKSQDGRCPYCGLNLAYGCQVDHKFPLVRGGSDRLSNYQLLCPNCNGLKAALTDAEFRTYLVEWRGWFECGRRAGLFVKPNSHMRWRRWWAVYTRTDSPLDPGQAQLSAVAELFEAGEPFSWYHAKQDDFVTVWRRGTSFPINLDRWRWLRRILKAQFKRVRSRRLPASQLGPDKRRWIAQIRWERGREQELKISSTVFDMLRDRQPFCWYRLAPRGPVAVWRNGLCRVVSAEDWRHITRPFKRELRLAGCEHLVSGCGVGRCGRVLLN
jgi:HNH endonuclease